MRSTLIADIGATNCRFALVGENGRPACVQKYRGDEAPSLQAAIARYLDEVSAPTEAAVIAVAAPVEGDAIAMTNRAWSFRLSELAKHFGWRAIRGLNDFEAAAWSLVHLTPDDIRPLGPVWPLRNGVRVVFGPGTGLGVAALVPNGKGFQALGTEAGHVLFGPVRPDEDEVFSRLRVQVGSVSAEAVLAGPGLERLHRALHTRAPPLRAAEIVAQAHAGEREPRATVGLFVRLLGRFAGDLALTFKALGGVYLAGGVARRIGAMLDVPAFREAFEAHPPYQTLMREIPTTLITLDEPGLLGCATLARTLEDGI